MNTWQDRMGVSRILLLASKGETLAREKASVVRAAARAARDRAVLDVRNQGMGIPASDLAHISARFHRASNVGRITGTGLGLAGARTIVAQHGGTLEIASQEGAGTTVTVELPLAPNITDFYPQS